MSKKSNAISQAPRPSIGVVEPEIAALRAFQSHTVEALDTKAGVVLGFTGTILAVLVPTKDPDWTVISIVGFVFLALAVLVGVLAMWPRVYRYDPSPATLYRDYLLRPADAPTDGSREKILADKVKAYELNEKVLKCKSLLVTIAAACLGAGILLISGNAVWRGKMTKTSVVNETTPTQGSSSGTPAPLAQPNPDATNIIKKGQRK